jgi:hypothetical protein
MLRNNIIEHDVCQANHDDPLSKAIDQQSAEWLEANSPVIFDALVRELEAGRSLSEIRKILRRKFGDDLREPFVVRILQAAEHMTTEMITK